MPGELAYEDQVPTPLGNSRSIRIGLLWHSMNSGNLGVGALTVANHAIARDAALALGFRPSFVVFAPRDAQPGGLALSDVDEVFRIDRKGMMDRKAYLKTISTLDCLLDIGAGDSFADIYGPRRFAFLWLTKAIAIARKIPLTLSPQTIGPFEKPVYRFFAKRVMRGSRMIFARDRNSLDLARVMAPGGDVRLAVDVAFELPFIDQSHERGGTRLRIGVNASGLLFHEAESGSNRFRLSYDYASMTRSLLAKLCARDDLDVYLIPHATSERDARDDDGALADRLAAEFPRTRRVANFDGPSDAKSFISSLDMLVAGRMHACIGALSSGTPVVPVAYSRKFSGLFGLLDYHLRIPEQGLTEAAAVETILAAIDARENVQLQVDAALANVAPYLETYREGLRQFFSEVMAPRT